jgi:hypothetical protein
MSLFSDLFDDSLETQVIKEINNYLTSIAQTIARENAALRSIGIKPPRLISELGCKHKAEGKDKIRVTLDAPQFDLPPHLIFDIKTDALVVTLFKNLEDAKSKYWWWGLGEVVNEQFYGCIWTNRDPFAIYRELQRKPAYENFLCDKPGDFTSVTKILRSDRLQFSDEQHTAEKLTPLNSAKSLSCEEAYDVYLRFQLYNYVRGREAKKEFDDSRYYYSLGYYDSRIPKLENILFHPPVPCPWIDINSYLCLKILPTNEIKPARMVEFLNSLHSVNHFISFELLREGETVCFRLQFPTAFESQIIAKLNLYFPDFELLYDDSIDPQTTIATNWLNKVLAYDSIQRLRDFQLDPYSHFAAFFDEAAPGELLCYQIIFAPLLDESASSIKDYLANTFTNDSIYLDKFVKKLPLWFVSVSISSTNEQTASTLTESVARTLDSPSRKFSEPYSLPLTNYGFPFVFPAFLSLFDTEELAALAHFPITDLPLERLEKVSMKNVQPPELYTTGDARLGESRASGQVFPVTIPETVRDRHVYVVGKSGTGKSTLIETIVRRDIEAGHGVAVIDPHGDLIQHLLDAMPEHRVSDCVLFSPRHFPVSLEILTAENENEIDLLSDDLVTMFRRTSESWGDKMQSILQMAFQTLLRVPGSSFTDINRLLTDERFRRQILSQIDHPQLASFWEQRYDVRQAEPILIRMDRLTTSGTLRAVLTQNKNSLNFYDVITESKIFLADLSKGYLGESTSHLLGSIIVSQIQLAAMRQAHLPAEQRIPFSLFVDEVQNFTTSAFSTILSEARKQKLRLTIAHQFVSQLPTDLQKAVFGNVGTLIFFALSPDDLGAARHELGTFEPADVANLPKYHALCRPATAAKDTFSFATDPPLPLPKQNFKEAIIEQTRREYAAPIESAGQGFSPPPQPVSPVQPLHNQASRQTAALQIDTRRPASASPPTFATNTEKILHFLRQAEYLAQPQIIALTNLLPPNASTALKKMVETGQIKSLDDRRPKIYFVGKSCNPTTHNLLVRDLFVKITASNFAVRSVKFNDNLTELNPDLTVEFAAENDGNPLTVPLVAYFELDRGTEGVQELVRKAERYARVPDNPRVGFVFEKESDLLLARKTIDYPFISYATLDQFTSLRDAAFRAAANNSAPDTQLPFFGS